MWKPWKPKLLIIFLIKTYDPDVCEKKLDIINDKTNQLIEYYFLVNIRYIAWFLSDCILKKKSLI